MNYWTAPIVIVSLSLFVVACDVEPAEESALLATEPETVSPKGSISVTIDESSYDFRPYGFCGNQEDGAPRAIGLRFDDKGQPVQEHAPLQITGSRESKPNIGVNPFTKIDFRFQSHHAVVYLEGEETVAFYEGVFEWSGEAPGNQALSVSVICP